MSDIDALLTPPTEAIWLTEAEVGLLKAGLATFRTDLTHTLAQPQSEEDGSRGIIRSLIAESLALTTRLTAVQQNLADNR